MRRSISICEPSYSLAGQRLTWRFHYTPASTLPAGTRLRFDLQSKGRSIDWTLPSPELKRGGSAFYLQLPDGEVVGCKECSHAGYAAYDFMLPKEIRSGSTLTFVLGGYRGSGKEEPESEIACQSYTQRRRTFYLHIDPKGKTQFDELEEFHLDIKGNLLQLIRVLTPAFVTRGKRFDVTIRFEDQFGNLTGLAPEDTLIELTYENLRENLNWKLFVPETGFITLPNLYFNEPGTYRIQLRNSATGASSLSAPIRCFSEEGPQLVWGTLHGDSEKISTLDEPEAALRHFRDEACYNFYGISPLASEEKLPVEVWKQLGNQVSEFNEEDRFSVFQGYQWIGSSPKEGLRQVLYSKDHRPLHRSDDIKSNSLKKLYKSLTAKETLSIPLLTMNPDSAFDFQEWDPEFERIVEIYNGSGCCECSAREDNPFPLSTAPGKPRETACGSLRAALNQGKRFGFVAGGIDQGAHLGALSHPKSVRYSAGLTAVLAKQHQRESIFEALYQRRCYATSGERILLDFMICNQPMGSEISALQKPGLVINRHLHGFVAGTQPLERVEIFRCGVLWKTVQPREGELNMELAIDDSSHPSEALLVSDERCFLYYYLRVTQKGGGVAWSSPIWIDFDCSLLGGKKGTSKAEAEPESKGKSSKAAPKPKSAKSSSGKAEKETNKTTASGRSAKK